jgi:trimethylamine--corrinoid protein Co-methyltransferase
MAMDEQNTQTSHARRPSGRDAKRAARAARAGASIPYITRKIPYYEVLSEEGLALMEHNADIILEEIGIDFRDDPEALEIWKAAGADVKGERVHFARGMCRSLIQRTAPREFTQHARNPARSVVIGGKNTVFAPAYGSPFVRSLDEGRRYARIEDFRNFVKLAYLANSLHHSGGTICEPVDLPVNKRHLDMVYSHLKYSDKAFMGSVTAPERAADSVAMANIVFGEELNDPLTGRPKTTIINLINVNSPMTYDATMLGAAKVYARANQALIITPFISLRRQPVRIEDPGCASGLRVGEHLAADLSRGRQFRAAHGRMARGRTGHGLRKIRHGCGPGRHDAHAARGRGLVGERPSARCHARSRPRQAFPGLRPHPGEFRECVLPFAARRQQ